MNKWWNKLFSPLSSKEGRKLNKTKYIIGLGIIGVLLILTSSWFKPSSGKDALPQEQTEQTKSHSSNDQVSASTDSIGQLESEYEKQLKPLLENIEGVSDVDIMINLSATQSKVYDKNLIIGKQTTKETDKNGGKGRLKTIPKKNSWYWCVKVTVKFRY
ncbi:hypothetical protein MUN89_11235 [Halobacillus salinarum]|uniref:Stage III sporulation protein AG n=1 Tax=Halobacillus salinarum TaxID=2932257 RepID=A0ABY4EF82_9BACI|nr:hypothetical protein [Halobacillus salinarum]UOQ42558.1 hypothetical protein MUN89_11235 [Halobacillus salinarum]